MFRDGRDNKKFNVRVNETMMTAGNSTLEIQGNEAWLSGETGAITYKSNKKSDQRPPARLERL